jgi:hypothetical protein
MWVAPQTHDVVGDMNSGSGGEHHRHRDFERPPMCWATMTRGVEADLLAGITYTVEHWQSGWRLAANQQQQGM